ncbi:uncharacterized protein LOC108864998 [Galendromus occidentalis]|uniref:Uncharacterized protein LOC108864998 n=1 Tax=Galendromus occidentalis TaxID=34638 RepID=A0AAJ7PAX3_9ACAR|nr:uncharacterized protein LOC108864998 [Galendromus occidentalis]
MKLIEQFVGGLSESNIQQAILTPAVDTDEVNKIQFGTNKSFSSKPRFPRKKNFTLKQTPNPKCSRCGDNNHLAQDCYFKNAECRVCRMKGHIAVVCRKTQNNHLLEEIPFNYVEGSLEDPILLSLKIHGRPIGMELDTGTATRELFEPKGFVIVPVEYRGRCEDLKLYLVDRPNFPTLLGRSWPRLLGLDALDIEKCHFTTRDYGIQESPAEIPKSQC